MIKLDVAKLRREYPISPYAVDLCCIGRKLIVEIDGEGHYTESGLEHDRVRDRYLMNLGYRILRIPGYAVIREDGNAIAAIREFIKETGESTSPSPPTPTPTPTPLPFDPQGRGEQEE